MDLGIFVFAYSFSFGSPLVYVAQFGEFVFFSFDLYPRKPIGREGFQLCSFLIFKDVDFLVVWFYYEAFEIERLAVFVDVEDRKGFVAHELFDVNKVVVKVV